MSEELDNTVFVIDTSSPEFRLSGLRSTASLLPLEHLEGWLAGFIEQEKFEEAEVIRKEIESRAKRE